MKCDFCDQKATVFLTHLENDQMKKQCLCESCATDKGVTDPLGLSLGGESFSPEPSSASAVSGREDISCPTCGFSMAHLKKVGRVGCADCYQTFRSEVDQMLPSMHTGLTHTGRVPEGLVEQQEQREKLVELQEALDGAIALENFEEAADIRDALAAMGQVTAAST